MIRFPGFKGGRRTVAAGLVAMAVVVFCTAAAAQEAFQVNLAEDGDTIGDMRPVFLKFSAQAMPSISPREVARRYQRLFDESDEPEVRIDALNRLTNLQARAGDLLTLSAEQEASIYREAIHSYEMIVSSGSFQGRLDELLYQSAKAYAYIGREQESVVRLKQLVGLYPSSELVPEARFRIAEAAYTNGHYPEAEQGYRQLLAGNADTMLKSRARYMLGWAQFKQGNPERAGETFLAVLDEFAEQSDGFNRLPAASADIIRDTFRIIGIMAANAGGEAALAELLAQSGGRSYDFLLYDTLADYYAARDRYQDSVAVVEAFLSRSPRHASAPAFRAQLVDVWQRAGDSERILAAKADYVAAYPADGEALLEGADLERWRDYARTLADYHYHRAGTMTASAAGAFATAAQYYQGLALRESAPGPVRRLAGDAWLQAGQWERALAMYEQAGFEDPAFEGAADAAWAAIRLRVDMLAEDGAATGLDQLATTADRFAGLFPADERLPALQADLANRLLAVDRNDEAAVYAARAVAHERVTRPDAYSAWLVQARVHMSSSRFSAAEQAWREALVLAGKDSEPGAGFDGAAVRDQLAISIYRQGEAARDNGDVDQAVAHFQRISSVHPDSVVAIKGRYDAATSLLAAQRWQAAINELQRFRSDYPGHDLSSGITDKLVHAYEASGQPVRAADELMAASTDSADGWPRRLRAAELYHRAERPDSRNRIYQDYLAQAAEPAAADDHLARQQMRQRLLASGLDTHRLRAELVATELASPWHSEQSLAWAAEAALVLARQAGDEFRAVRLTLPLHRSLSRKQQTLDAARQWYRQADTLGGDQVRSQSLYHRAELYRALAADIRASSLPAGLTELEASQYRLLLDEQAYPFEDKAIELHVANHQLVSRGVYDQWVRQSLQALAELFPGRYARKPQWISGQEEPNNDA